MSNGSGSNFPVSFFSELINRPPKDSTQAYLFWVAQVNAFKVWTNTKDRNVSPDAQL